MNLAAQRAILKAFRQAGVEAGGTLTREDLLDGFRHHYPHPDQFDVGIADLIEAMFIDCEDETHGPYTLTEDGYSASLNFE